MTCRIPALVLAVAMVLPSLAAAYSGPWCKGALHVHTLADDGTVVPEVAIERYRLAGFTFISITDHWPGARDDDFAIRWTHDGSVIDGAIAQYASLLLGRPEITDTGDGGWQYTIFSHAKTKQYFEQERDAATRAIVIKGQELTGAGTGPAHVLVLQAAEELSSVDAATNAGAYDAMISRARDAALAAEAGITAPLVYGAHLNWQDAGPPASTIRTWDWQGLEIYSGHSHTLPHGYGMAPPSQIRLLDQVNQWRVANGWPLMLALAADDAHDWYGEGPRPPLRAWVEVECDADPTEAEISQALEAGRFHATTGVAITSYTVTDEADGSRCLSLEAANADARVTVLGILRDATAAVPARVITSASGSVVDVCPNAGTFGLARIEIRDRGRRLWTQHVRLWQGDDP